MYYTLTVALPGHIDPDKLRDALTEAMAPFDKQLEVDPYPDHGPGRRNVLGHVVIRDWHGSSLDFDAEGWPIITSNPNGEWDWWVIGGRWGGNWILKIGGESGLPTENHAFGRTDSADDDQRTDCARVRDIQPKSLRSYAYLTLDGQWHSRWLGPGNGRDEYEIPPEEFAAEYLRWIAALPGETWLVNVDFHC